jgi:hypothetical protein
MEKKSVGLLELETAVLECFLEKTPLSPLGVKERNLIKRRHIFWSSIREMGIMSDGICQISLTSGEIEGHCPLKFGDS